MTAADALSIARESIYVALKLGAPAMLLALAVGLAISFFQALTQIQEMTLTFVPKIVVIFAVVSLTGSFIGGQFYVFTENVYARIEHGFGN